MFRDHKCPHDMTLHYKVKDRDYCQENKVFWNKGFMVFYDNLRFNRLFVSKYDVKNLYIHVNKIK